MRMRPQARWLAPCPLWTDFLRRSPDLMRRPALLRFASDSFMEDLQALLADDPTRLLGLIARPETWRTPTVGLTPLPATSSGAGSSASGATSGSASGDAGAAGSGAAAGSTGGLLLGSDILQVSLAPQLTLYQPVHQRFYLVAAVLVCRMPGLPERTVVKSAGERVGFVLRQVQPPDGGSDADLFLPGTRRVFAWVPGQPTGRWVEAQESVLIADEERLPLFPLASPKLGRQLWAGLVPVARRQAYSSGRVVEATTAPAAAGVATGSGSVAATTSSASSAATSAGASAAPPDADAQAAAVAAQLLDFRHDVLEPWGELDDWLESPAPDPTQTIADYYRAMDHNGSEWKKFNYSIELNSALILADFARQLKSHLPDVWSALGAGSSSGLGSLATALYDDLQTPPTTAAYGTFADALAAADQKAAAFESLDSSEPLSFPSGYSPVRLDDQSWKVLIERDVTLGYEVQTPPLGVRRLKRRLEDALTEVVEAAVTETGALPADATAAAAERAPVQAPADPGAAGWYVLQCVYEQPECGRNCAPVVSDSSEPFRMASFFDADAPARTLPVALPVDTTPAALRKYDRNVVFTLSDELRRQISRVKSMKDLTDGNIGDADPSVGFSVVCSLSIPIITICALILLMIMVSVLNIIFWWLPYFLMCFPIPKLKAKGA